MSSSIEQLICEWLRFRLGGAALVMVYSHELEIGVVDYARAYKNLTMLASTVNRKWRKLRFDHRLLEDQAFTVEEAPPGARKEGAWIIRRRDM